MKFILKIGSPGDLDWTKWSSSSDGVCPVVHYFKLEQGYLTCQAPETATVPNKSLSLSSVLFVKDAEMKKCAVFELNRRQLLLQVSVSYGFVLELVIDSSLGFNSVKPQGTFLRVPVWLPMCVLFEALCVCREQQGRQWCAQLSVSWGLLGSKVLSRPL